MLQFRWKIGAITTYFFFRNHIFLYLGAPDKPKIYIYKSALADFQNPPPEYSTAPFWVWNYIITKPMIDEQLRLYKEIGVNQVIIHPRPGLVTEYLLRNGST